MILQETPNFTMFLEGTKLDNKIIRINPFSKSISDWRFTLLDSTLTIELQDDRNGTNYKYFMTKLQRWFQIKANGVSLFYGRIFSVEQGLLKVILGVSTVIDVIKNAKFTYEYEYTQEIRNHSAPKVVTDRFGTNLLYLGANNIVDGLMEAWYGSWLGDTYHDVTYNYPTGGSVYSGNFYGTNGERVVIVSPTQLEATQTSDLLYHIYAPDEGVNIFKIKSGTCAVLGGTKYNLVLLKDEPIAGIANIGTSHYYLRKKLVYSGRLGTVVEQMLNGSNTNINLGTDWYDRDSLMAAESYILPLQVKKTIMAEGVGSVIKELRLLLGAVMVDGYINNEGKLVVASIMPFRRDTMDNVISISKIIDTPLHSIDLDSVVTKVTYRNDSYSYSVGMGTSPYGYSKEITIENDWVKNTNFFDVSAYRRLLLYKNGLQKINIKLPIGMLGTAQIGTIFSLISDVYPAGHRYLISKIKVLPHLLNGAVSNVGVQAYDYEPLSKYVVGLWTDGTNGCKTTATSAGGWGTELGGTEGTAFGINPELGSQFVWW